MQNIQHTGIYCNSWTWACSKRLSTEPADWQDLLGKLYRLITKKNFTYSSLSTEDYDQIGWRMYQKTHVELDVDEIAITFKPMILIRIS